MVLTKQYLRFEPVGIFGVVAAKTCNSVFLNPQTRFVAAGGTNIVMVWDTRLHRKVSTLHCDSPAVVIEPNNNSSLLAVGHINGSVSIYDITDKSGESIIQPKITFDGHKSSVTSLTWDDSGTLLASGSRDTRIVVWDCVEEVGVIKFTAHKGSITHLQFWKDAYLISSSTDATIRIWDMSIKDVVHTIPFDIAVKSFQVWNNIIIAAESQLRLMKIEQDEYNPLQWTTEEFGTLLRNAHDRIGIVKLVGNHIVTVGTKSPLIETFRINSDEVATKKMKKRLKKNPDGTNSVILRDLIFRGPSVRASEEKLKSIDCVIEKDKVKILCTLPSNQLEVVDLLETDTTNEEKPKDKKPDLFGFDGHRKIIRAACFSSDKTAIITASGDSFKVWNRSTMSCILTIQHDYPVVSCKFCPGDRHFIAGTSCGNLLLGDIPLGKLTHVEPSGSDSVWSIDILPNNMGFAACNGAHLQLFEFLMVDGGLKFETKRQLDVKETILSLKISPDMKFVATGLMDNTIKIFYLDTLKFHLSMYGHSLPVVAIDISSDSTLLVSCSGDKTVRVWGMDFGDCHCSMTHSDGLVGCNFLERTHHVVSVAKETMNLYDADIHQRIQTLKGHVEGGATCVTTLGKFIVSAGKDQTIRLFNKTDEVLVLSDEREQEREEELDKEATEEVPGVAPLKTSESEKSADKLIDALDVYKSESTSHPLMAVYGARTSDEFILKTLNVIKASELEQSIMLLPLEYVKTMITAIDSILSTYPLATENAFRCLNALMKFHRVTLTGYVDQKSFKNIAILAEQRHKELQDIVGFNLAALNVIQSKKQEKQKIFTFKEMVSERKRKRKSKATAMKRALLTIV